MSAGARHWIGRVIEIDIGCVVRGSRVTQCPVVLRAAPAKVVYGPIRLR
ncbi:Uncharacterised protein [Mycobacteroides abscessus subsp. abscessus]|nr:Uncharacterised protein [Mycobacteroides abscessus subsp. abscessus]